MAQASPAEALARFGTFESVISLIRANRDVQLLIEVENDVRLARYAPGRIEFEPAPGAAPDLSQRLQERLRVWTGARWAVVLVSGGGAPSITEARMAEKASLEAEALAHPMVQAVLDAFPDAKIAGIRTPDEIAAEAEVESLAAVEDEWDPFEEE